MGNHIATAALAGVGIPLSVVIQRWESENRSTYQLISEALIRNMLVTDIIYFAMSYTVEDYTDLPKPHTVHPFSDIYYDPNFVSSSLEILRRHNLLPLEPTSWNRSCWHSNYGYCSNRKNEIIFAKIFKPDLKENAVREIEARELVESIHVAGLYIPRIIEYFPDDLCLVMEPATGNNLVALLNEYEQCVQVIDLLSTVLLKLRKKTLSKTSEDYTKRWILTRAQRYSSSLKDFHQLLGIFSGLPEMYLQIKNMRSSCFALGDLTPTHLYWHASADSLVYVDLELARFRPDFFDVAYFCHRLLTRYRDFEQDYLSSITLSFLKSFEIGLDTSERETFRENVISLIGLRMVGGLVDCLIIKDGTAISQHLTAWKNYHKLISKLDSPE